MRFRKYVLCFLALILGADASAKKQLPTYVTPDGGKEVIPVIDMQGHLVNFRMTKSVLSAQMSSLKQLGFNKLYLVQCQPGFPMFSSPRLAPYPKDNDTHHHLRESIELLDGDPDRAYAEVCNNMGIEPVAIIKLYECGGGVTIPSSRTAPGSLVHEDCVGGKRVYFDEFLSTPGNLKYRLKRKDDVPELAYTGTVTRIELDYMYDSFKNYGRPRQEQEFLAYSKVSKDKFPSVIEKKLKGLTLWISKDNGHYEPYPLESSQIHWKFVTKPVYNASGTKIYDDKQQFTVIVDGLSFGPEYKYFAISYEDRSGLYNIPYTMNRLYCGDVQIPCTASVNARRAFNCADDPDTHVWGEAIQPMLGSVLRGIKANGKVAEAVPFIVDGKPKNTQNFEYFYKWGFEFEWLSTTLLYGHGFSPTAAVCLARGKNEYAKGTVCEAYPEVREYWLKQVEHALECGYKAIDFRMQYHSGMVADYTNYGYNEPIIERYKQKWGVDITREEADFEKIMDIRGEFLMEFLEQASELIHSKGARMIMHMRAAYAQPLDFTNTSLNSLLNWTMPKVRFDWKKAIDLSDEIVIKDYCKGVYDSKSTMPIKQYARQQGKPVWCQLYMQQGNELNDEYIKEMTSDGSIDGIQLYEVVFDSPTWMNRIRAQLERTGYERKR